MLAGEPAEPLDRDLGVLVKAEDVLQRNDSLGERARPARVEIGEELERIPQPLAPDSYPVVLGRRRVALDLLGRLAKRAEALLDQVRRHRPRRQRALAGATAASRAEEAAEAADEELVSARVEGIEHRLSGS